LFIAQTSHNQTGPNISMFAQLFNDRMALHREFSILSKVQLVIKSPQPSLNREINWETNLPRWRENEYAHSRQSLISVKKPLQHGEYKSRSLSGTYRGEVTWSAGEKDK